MPEPVTPTDPADAAPAASREAGPAARTGGGPGRLLVAVYGVFALAAGARAGVQIATRFDEAPLAYLLSALAAIVYVLATVALALGGRLSRRVAAAACSLELAGVLVIGTFSLVDAESFPDETVWSAYGRGYGFVPLVLPVIGLAWLWHTGRKGTRTSA
ncbi:hypothetical protein [Thermomonospora curvata]|uniref:Integral membrane protein n=1 Tax=Thermomonospora curvata (strain ATCC 19995 / DSM 43183 / JCM 3096 / KCTC 9072 / NBRC 15933 / NCIMB 10081 / Henssen B9) TaxID=471852 RepID=D1ADU5_THECD|nr:hypothetical protein Tcur_1988 [Thermomonospora curvata DSM 43183]PKK14503.1 MAG: hypothetical protein BUE48_009695 [Thermomonospora sp. CIF 1]